MHYACWPTHPGESRIDTYFSAAVYVSFEETFLYVNESEVVDVCLVLGNATEPTKDSLTVQVSSAMGSASGKILFLL